MTRSRESVSLPIIRRNRLDCSASDSAYSYTFLFSVVCLSVCHLSVTCLSVICHIRAPCLNRWTDLDAIWQVGLHLRVQ